MRIGLVTDSPADLPEDLINRFKIEVVPAILVMNGQSYLDGLEISRSDFYQQLPGLNLTPTTAAPPNQEFTQRFQKLLDSGCTYVIGIFTSEKLTSIADTARKSAEDFAGRVCIIESGSLSMGSGFQVLAAAEAIEKGLELSDILTKIDSVRKRLRVFAALDTIEYLRRSGRVPRAVATLGGLLKIKPVVELYEGEVKPIDTPRTSRKAVDKLVSLISGCGPLEYLSILHTNAEDRARQLLAQITLRQGSLLPNDIYIINVTSVIGTHVGPNGVGIAAVTRQASNYC